MKYAQPRKAKNITAIMQAAYVPPATTPAVISDTTAHTKTSGKGKHINNDEAKSPLSHRRLRLPFTPLS